MGSAPLGALGNLRLTSTGMYAEYLLSGVPFVFLSEHWQNTVAAEHAELWRSLPSGAQISGLTVPVPARSIIRRMLANDTGLGWVRHCRAWEPTLGRDRARRRLYWLSLPLEYGRRITDLVIGKDKHTAESVAHYRQLAADMVAALPAVFFPKPVSVEQIWWHWNYTASRGAWHRPLPTRPHDPNAGLPASAFSPVNFKGCGS